MIRTLREWMFRTWYWYVNNVDKNAEVLFMNYGYSSPDMRIDLCPADEPNRHSIQLYHLLGSAVDLKHKAIAEIGCGRGGGLSYLARTFSPATALGVDLEKNAVRFCSKHYAIDGLSFSQGDAQSLPFLKSDSFDAILNVESSHRYPRMDSFLTEVCRILRPGGYFLYTDFRCDHEMAELKQLLAKSGMIVLKERTITDNVVKALEADDPRRRMLIERLTPRFLHKAALNFAGTIGSETYTRFAAHRYEYYCYVMQKK